VLALFAWPEPPSVTRGELSADVRDGMEAPALGGTEFPRGGILANADKKLAAVFELRLHR
jgi:hypothetical protein